MDAAALLDASPGLHCCAEDLAPGVEILTTPCLGPLGVVVLDLRYSLS